MFDRHVGTVGHSERVKRLRDDASIDGGEICRHVPHTVIAHRCAHRSPPTSRGFISLCLGDVELTQLLPEPVAELNRVAATCLCDGFIFDLAALLVGHCRCATHWEFPEEVSNQFRLSRPKVSGVSSSIETLVATSALPILGCIPRVSWRHAEFVGEKVFDIAPSAAGCCFGSTARFACRLLGPGNPTISERSNETGLDRRDSTDRNFKTLEVLFALRLRQRVRPDVDEDIEVICETVQRR
ncbi:MAG: hypothetical protein WD007_00035 [Nitriliruptoraceae bacterium]